MPGDSLVSARTRRLAYSAKKTQYPANFRDVVRILLAFRSSEALQMIPALRLSSFLILPQRRLAFESSLTGVRNVRIEHFCDFAG
jgi:hypothetical protein